MVGWKEASEALPVLHMAVAGGAAGALTRGVCHPLDVLKIRFQLQTEPLRNSPGSKYSSLLQATALIVREEGVGALWSGHVPAQLLSISYGLVQFVAFEKLSEVVHKADPEMSKVLGHGVNFACGAVAAGAAAVTSFPFDTIRTRLIAEGKSQRVYSGVWNTCVHMSRTEGPRSLYKGLFPTLAQIAPYAGLQFATYHLFSDLFHNSPLFKRSTSLSHTMIANLLAGSIAGLVSKLAIYPFDLAKKRLQIQGFQQHRKNFGQQFFCNGFIDCMRMIVKQETFLGLYKGLSPSLMKAVLATALHFSVYDELKHFFQNKKS